MPELRVRAILFDMDGTLVDSTAMVEQVWTEFAAANGADAREVIDFAHGRPSRDTIAAFTAASEDVDTWNATLTRWEAERFGDAVEIPGALTVVKAVPHGRWAVVTSALSEPARNRLLAAGFPTPRVLIGADDVERGKPDPWGYREAARALGVDARDCVVFEDTPAGLDAGRAAGCEVIGVGASAPAELRVDDLTQVSIANEGEWLTVTISPA